MTSQGLSPSGHFLDSFLMTPHALYLTLEPHRASWWPLYISCFFHMSLPLCSHCSTLPLAPDSFPSPCAEDLAPEGFPVGVSSLCPLAHTSLFPTCFLVPGLPELWALWRMTDKGISSFVLLSLVRRKHAHTFCKSRDIAWDHSRAMGCGWDGMEGGFQSPCCVSVHLIQSKIWRGSRLNPSNSWKIPSVLSKLGAQDLAKVESQEFNLGKSNGDRCRGRRLIWSIWPSEGS